MSYYKRFVPHQGHTFSHNGIHLHKLSNFHLYKRDNNTHPLTIYTNL